MLSSDRPVIALTEADDVRVVRISGTEYDDMESRVRFTFSTEWDGTPLDFVLLLQLQPTINFIVALLSGLGLPEGDLTYLADRLSKELL